MLDFSETAWYGWNFLFLVLFINTYNRLQFITMAAHQNIWDKDWIAIQKFVYTEKKSN
jgi:hypothetical protein